MQSFKPNSWLLIAVTNNRFAAVRRYRVARCCQRQIEHEHINVIPAQPFDAV